MGKGHTVIVATDGACKGNPGPGGWGAVLRWGDVVKTLSGGEADTTNNRSMELLAAIGARRAQAPARSNCRPTASMSATASPNGSTVARNGWKTAAKKPVANADLQQRLVREAARHEIEWLWVKGHAGHGDNELADKLASDAALAIKR